MHRLDSIDGLRARLLGIGIPAGYVARLTRELEEHRRDVLEELRDAGVSGGAAELEVNARMGSFDELAVQLSTTLRRSTWCGRHPVVIFCVLPVLTFMASFALALALVIGVAEVAGWQEYRAKLTPGHWMLATGLAQGVRWALFAAIPFWFCWLARSAFCGYRWAFATCLVFSLHGLLHQFSIVAPAVGGKGSLSWGYGTHLDWIGLSVPLLVFGLFVILSKYTNATEVRHLESRP